MGQTRSDLREVSEINSLDRNRLNTSKGKRYGQVIVKISSLSNSSLNERPNVHTVSNKGAIFFGSHTSSARQAIIQALISKGITIPPDETNLLDSRANQILIAYFDGWYVFPSPEIFSRHSGTCIVLGDRKHSTGPREVEIGDCYRLGSVGLVVSEIRYPNGEEKRLDTNALQYLKEEALAFDSQEDEACLAAEEEEEQLNIEEANALEGQKSFSKLDDKEETVFSEKNNSSKSNKRRSAGSAAGTTKFFCYMCYENHDTTEDPLVAPCDCKGDTRYLHVQCLQKWHHSSTHSAHSQVIRTTGSGAAACKICGSAYKTVFRNHEGVKLSLLEVDTRGPYISFVVVTKHDTSPGLFNTKFRLNFTASRVTGPDHQMEHRETTEISIGRSSACNMVLDYRTVSTTHAKMSLKDGKFYMQDMKSSNGTMVFVQSPFKLQYNKTEVLRMGRTTLSLQAKRSWSAALRGSLFDKQNRHSKGIITELHTQICENVMSKEGWGRHGSLTTDVRNENNFSTLRSLNTNPYLGQSNNPYLGLSAPTSSGIYNIRFGRDGEVDVDDYGFPRVHNFTIPSLRFDDLESRLAALPQRNGVTPLPVVDEHAIVDGQAEMASSRSDLVAPPPPRHLTMLVRNDDEDDLNKDHLNNSSPDLLLQHHIIASENESRVLTQDVLDNMLLASSSPIEGDYGGSIEDDNGSCSDEVDLMEIFENVPRVNHQDTNSMVGVGNGIITSTVDLKVNSEQSHPLEDEGLEVN